MQQTPIVAHSVYIEESAKRRKSVLLTTATPTLPISFSLNMDSQVHAALSRQIVNAILDILEIRVRCCDDVDDAADFGCRSRCVVVAVSVVMVIVRVDGFSVVEPESWHGVADDTAHFAELLERVLNAVFEVVGHDEQELLA